MHELSIAHAIVRTVTDALPEPDARVTAVRVRIGALAGVVNLNAILRGSLQGAYLGFYAHADHAGQGLMTEAIHLALARAFRVLKLHRIEANVQPNNHRSLATVARCGFRREGFSPGYLKIGGRWRDHERWGILAKEWRAPFRVRLKQ